MSLPIAVIGAGGWGTALAITLSRANREVRLWTFESYLVETILATRENPLYLPGAKFRSPFRVTNSMEETLAEAGIVIIAVPSHVFRTVLARMLPSLTAKMIFVSAAKGIENESLMRMSEVILDVFRNALFAKSGW